MVGLVPGDRLLAPLEMMGATMASREVGVVCGVAEERRAIGNVRILKA